MHFINDLHPTFLPALLPKLVTELSLSLAQAGFINFLFGGVNLFVQPLAGHLADRQRKPRFALWAPALTALGACLLPISSSFALAVFFVLIMAIGTSCFHPQGHALAGLSGGKRHLGLYLAIFAAAGTAGAALSPLYSVFLYRHLGSNIPLAFIPVILIALIVSRIVHWESLERNTPLLASETTTPKKNFLSGLYETFKKCRLLVFISIIRDSTAQGIRVFLPLLVTSRGGSIEMGGTVLFAFTLAGAVANLIGGRLADRFGKMKLTLTLLTIAPLFLFPAIRSDGLISIVLFTLGGAMLVASSPVTIALAQERSPESRSAVSSLVMGVAWGIANLVALPIGKLADMTNLTLALGLVSLLPWAVITTLLIRRFLFNK